MSNEVTGTRRRGGIFYGWWILIACLLIGAYIGGVYFFGFSVFFEAIVAETGWSRAATALAFSLASLEGGIEGPIIGPLVDRYGPRRLMFGGIIIVGIAFVALSAIDSLPTYYAVYLLLALGANTANGLAPTAAVANWFLRRRSVAFGIISTGFSFGGFTVTALGWLVYTVGWRTAALIVGVAAWIIGVPLTLVVRHRPEAYGYLPDGDPVPPSAPAVEVTHEGMPIVALSTGDLTLGEAVRTRAFWMISLAFAMRGLVVSAVVAHQVPLLVDRGFDAPTASSLLGLVAVMSFFGRIIFGFLGDFYSKRLLFAATFSLLLAALMVLLTAMTVLQVFMYSLLMGLGWGCVPLVFGMRADYFGRTAFATIGGFIQALSMTGAVVGPVFAGWVFDVTGNYEFAIITFACAAVVATVAALFATPPRRG